MAIDWLFQNTTPTSTASTTQLTGETSPQWLQDFTRGLVSQGVDIASQPYQPYGGPRIANWSAPQMQAWSQVAANQGSWQPGLNAGQSAVQGAIQPFSQEQLNPFLSPYIGGVVEEMGRLGTRQFQEQILPQTLSPFVGAGQFGSTRSMDFANRAARDFGADLAGRQGAALQQAYDSAMNQYGNWAQRGIQGGQTLGALNELRQKLGMSDAAQLEAVGNTQRQGAQQRLDMAYQDFVNQRDYPLQQLTMLNNLVRGLPIDRSGYSTGTQTTPNLTGVSPLAQAGAGASGLDALRKLLGIV